MIKEGPLQGLPIVPGPPVSSDLPIVPDLGEVEKFTISLLKAMNDYISNKPSGVDNVVLISGLMSFFATSITSLRNSGMPKQVEERALKGILESLGYKGV